MACLAVGELLGEVRTQGDAEVAHLSPQVTDAGPVPVPDNRGRFSSKRPAGAQHAHEHVEVFAAA